MKGNKDASKGSFSGFALVNDKKDSGITESASAEEFTNLGAMYTNGTMEDDSDI